MVLGKTTFISNLIFFYATGIRTGAGTYVSILATDAFGIVRANLGCTGNRSNAFEIECTLKFMFSTVLLRATRSPKFNIPSYLKRQNLRRPIHRYRESGACHWHQHAMKHTFLTLIIISFVSG
jgi:hypothetical protein